LAGIELASSCTGKWLSRLGSWPGIKCLSRELRELIFRMVSENPTWGAPHIHGELKILGFDISERTVLRRNVK